jgi:hypothetical protein
MRIHAKVNVAVIHKTQKLTLSMKKNALRIAMEMSKLGKPIKLMTQHVQLTAN